VGPRPVALPLLPRVEVRDQPLGVLAGAPATTRDVVAHAQLIRQWSTDVDFFANGTTLTADQREQLLARAIGIVAPPSPAWS
jgi:hypothetical protein